MKLILLFILILSASTTLQAQEKYEKEFRISELEVPKSAKDFVGSLAFNKKIKWFREEGIDRYSFEAKSKIDRVKYSVEFDSNGVIEDIELSIAWKDIDLNIRSVITDYLDESYQKYRFIEIQKQYTGDPQKMIQGVNGGGDAGLIVKYEIVLHSKMNHKIETIEYLFSARGEVERKSKVIFQNLDHLEF